MPYKVVGKNVLVKKNGKWRVKYRHSSHAKAVAQKKALYANVKDA